MPLPVLQFVFFIFRIRKNQFFFLAVASSTTQQLCWCALFHYNFFHAVFFVCSRFSSHSLVFRVSLCSFWHRSFFIRISPPTPPLLVSLFPQCKKNTRLRTPFGKLPSRLLCCHWGDFFLVFSIDVIFFTLLLLRRLTTFTTSSLCSRVIHLLTNRMRINSFAKKESNRKSVNWLKVACFIQFFFFAECDLCVSTEYVSLFSICLSLLYVQAHKYHFLRSFYANKLILVFFSMDMHVSLFILFLSTFFLWLFAHYTVSICILCGMVIHWVSIFSNVHTTVKCE